MSPIIQSLANGSARGYGAFFGAAAGPAFESIASATGTGSSGTITFSSIPSTYQHLQIRCNMRDVFGGATTNMTFNGSSSSYARHWMVGDGSTVTATGNASHPFMTVQFGASDATYPVASIIDIHNYSSTTQNKTVRIFTGVDTNSTTGNVFLLSGLWANTAAINSITITHSSDFATSSTFALYGIKGA